MVTLVVPAGVKRGGGARGALDLTVGVVVQHVWTHDGVVGPWVWTKSDQTHPPRSDSKGITEVARKPTGE